MSSQIISLSEVARKAARAQDWNLVYTNANAILNLDPQHPEGHFLSGLVERVANRPLRAIAAFEQTLRLDANRYDAAVELANQFSVARRNKEALELLDTYQDKLSNSSMYLDLAGTVYTEIGLPEKALPLYEKANQVQPGIDLFQANLASCYVFLGKIKEAKDIYQSLLQRFPKHQRNHYQLSRLEKAKDKAHIEQMEALLVGSEQAPDQFIFLYFAIGKEYEDLGEWDKAFEYYQKGGDAVTSVAKYNIKTDLDIIDAVIESCTKEWLEAPFESPENTAANKSADTKTPIFIVGLPRTGTTLTERIISSHSQVQTIGETQFMQMVLRRESGVQTIENMNAEMIKSLVDKDPSIIAKGYLDCVDYRLGEQQYFIDKLPFNFLFLGFIAKAYPDAKIIHLGRNPLDACFSMYKQIFTWAYKFSYSQDGLAQYYCAYDRLRNHWRDVLQDRLIEVEYEAIASNTEAETKILLEKLGLDFEQACLDFDKNDAPSATASSVQIREKAHVRSIDKWRNFEKHLAPLKEHLEKAGIKLG
jgi:tetratricopeptide (TPR) repeat protein